MLNEIVDGMSEAIHEAFGDGYDIYTDANEQGLTPPCFGIFPVRPSQSQVLGPRYLKRYPMCVNYFPPPGAEDAQTRDVMDRLFGALEIIRCGGDLVRGTDMSAEISDGVVVFCVDYNFHVHRLSGDEITMTTMEMREKGNEQQD